MNQLEDLSGVRPRLSERRTDEYLYQGATLVAVLLLILTATI